MEQFNSGEVKKIFRIRSHTLLIGLIASGKHVWQEGKEIMKVSVLHSYFRNNYLYPSSSRTFRTQSYWSFITGQCGYSEHFLPVHYHVGCAFNLHSIISSGINTWRWKFEQKQTLFFLPIGSRDKSHKDLEKIDLSVPRRAQYLQKRMEETSRRSIYWIDINLAIRKGLTFYQTRSNAMVLQGILPAYCIPKVVRLKTGEVLYEKSIHVSSTTTKNIITTRSRLDQRESSIGFYSCVEQERDSILPACWSYGQRTSRSCKDWPQWTTSCTTLAQFLKENIKTRYFGLMVILRLKKRIEILSDSIECNHPPRNTSSLLYSESC